MDSTISIHIIYKSHTHLFSFYILRIISESKIRKILELNSNILKIWYVLDAFLIIFKSMVLIVLPLDYHRLFEAEVFYIV